MISRLGAWLLAWSVFMPQAAQAQAVTMLQAAPLRAERSAVAEPRAQLASGQPVALLQLSGGWAEVQVAGGAQRGWVRASSVNMADAEVAAASRLDTGRMAANNHAVPLGVRALPPRANRHAFIVGVGEYVHDPARVVPALAGVPHDMGSALAIARHLQVPTDNITMLRDKAATRDNVQQALADLARRVQPGDRVFVYWSGHGSRYFDAAEGGCVETLVPHDLKDISNRQFAQWLQPLAGKAEKLMVVYDACHSGGLGALARPAGSAAPSRSLAATWAPKSAAAGQASCNQASNVRNRSFDAAARGLGLDGQDVVHLSSSRPDEVSFDNPATGGLATHALRQCLSGEARDLDGSGAISMAELAACAQLRIDRAIAGQADLLPHHLVLTGNRGFVPAWFAAPGSQPPSAVTAPGVWAAAPGPAASPARPPPVQPVPAVPPPAAAGETSLRQVLVQLHEQRDSKRRVVVVPTSERLHVGRDALDFAMTSSHPGHVYVAMLGSDQKSLYLLFPNALDQDNRIAAGQTLMLPRQAWRVVAGGPAGDNTLLVMVTDGPRDLAALGAQPAGPFAKALTDARGRARLQWLLGQRTQACQGPGCSDAFGSALLKIEEY